VQTAEPIAQATGLPLETNPGLRERAFGVFEGSTPDQIRERYPDEHARWQAREPGFVIPGGESLLQLQARARDCLDAISADTSTAAPGADCKVIIVTHGGVLDALYRIAAGAALDAPRTWQLLNASINHITIDAHGWRVGVWGDITHLPAAEDDFG
jgi:2,3-bisphosphoglycerate-dependent phosphoglycerate mutase